MEKLRLCPVCEEEKYDSWMECEDHFLTHEKFTIVVCRNCGFKFVNPRPQSRDLGKYYQSAEYSSHNTNTKSTWNFLYRNIRKYTIRKKYSLITRYSDSGSILDIGCASGEFLDYFKKNGWTVQGIEPDEKTRQQAIENYGLNIGDEPDIEQLISHSFDVITMWHVLEHVSELNRRMEDLKRLLKAEGTLFIALPNCNSIDAELYSKYWAAYDVPRHLYHFTAETASRLLNKYGFTLIEKIPMKLDSFYVSLLSEKYLPEKKNWLRGSWNGLMSNVRANKQTGYSSMIYAARLKTK